jgi:hypothetical protein
MKKALYLVLSLAILIPHIGYAQKNKIKIA